jgi:hypothetical protein
MSWGLWRKPMTALTWRLGCSTWSSMPSSKTFCRKVFWALRWQTSMWYNGRSRAYRTVTFWSFYATRTSRVTTTIMTRSCVLSFQTNPPTPNFTTLWHLACCMGPVRPYIPHVLAWWMGLATKVIPILSSPKLRTPPTTTQLTNDETMTRPSPTPRKCNYWKFGKWGAILCTWPQVSVFKSALETHFFQILRQPKFHLKHDDVKERRNQTCEKGTKAA